MVVVVRTVTSQSVRPVQERTPWNSLDDRLSTSRQTGLGAQGLSLERGGTWLLCLLHLPQQCPLGRPSGSSEPE